MSHQSPPDAPRPEPGPRLDPGQIEADSALLSRLSASMPRWPAPCPGRPMRLPGRLLLALVAAALVVPGGWGLYAKLRARAQHQQRLASLAPVREALSALQDLEAATGVGLGYQEYQRRVADATVAYARLGREQGKRKEGPGRRSLRQAELCYLEAEEIWSGAINRGSSGLSAEETLLLQRLWHAAGLFLRQAQMEIEGAGAEHRVQPPRLDPAQRAALSAYLAQARRTAEALLRLARLGEEPRAQTEVQLTELETLVARLHAESIEPVVPAVALQADLGLAACQLWVQHWDRAVEASRDQVDARTAKRQLDRTNTWGQEVILAYAGLSDAIEAARPLTGADDAAAGGS
jgi:hypothetical protein